MAAAVAVVHTGMTLLLLVPLLLLLLSTGGGRDDGGGGQGDDHTAARRTVMYHSSARHLRVCSVQHDATNERGAGSGGGECVRRCR